MGLNVSHGAWDGSYLNFDRFRGAVCAATGGTWPDEHDAPWWFGPGFDSASHPGLHAFLDHPDNEGEIPPGDAARLADEMEQLLPKLDAAESGSPGWTWGRVARRWIEGCRRAAAAREPLRFS